ncbi:hypothetical protein MMC09_002317 [Bachmanniomyces sp. S44760]|nr:hypothetical protein [Bachmanniomyces sp. S44760]
MAPPLNDYKALSDKDLRYLESQTIPVPEYRHYFIDHPQLYYAKTRSYPRVFDIELWPEIEVDKAFMKGFTAPHLADGVVTILYNYDPDILKKFLEWDHPGKMFEFDRKEDDGTGMTIQLKGHTVTCGWYRDRRKRDWNFQVKFRINSLGNWRPLSGLSEMGLAHTSGEIDDLGLEFLRAAFYEKMWIEADDAKIVVSAGGKVC